MKLLNYNKFSLILHLVVLLLFNTQTKAQEVFMGLPDQFKQYSNKIHLEKMYVHTDKNFYVAGELLWFKIYNVDGSLYQPADLSKISYIEIIDKDNKPVMQTKVPLSKGKGNGSFFLPVSINSGNYKLRAYTNWMKNFSAAYYFEKPVTIVNTLKTLTIPAADTTTHYHVAFFPEGGSLVKDVSSKVAFQVTDRFGKGMDCKGVVLSEKNDTLLSFQSFKFGMGHFMITPTSSMQNAKAVITLANGHTIIQNLPAAYEQGYVMQLSEETAGTIKVTVTSHSTPTQPVYLFGYTRQTMQVAEKQIITNGMATFLIDKNKLADGISTLTVFNERQQPVCERLFFNKPQHVLSVEASSNAAQYGIRKRVALSVNTQHTNTQTGSPANLSVAVYRLDSLQAINPNSLLSYLWLTSELAGNIESPSWYLTTDNEEVKEATDNLLLVHGWRKFDWDQVFNENHRAFEFVPEFDGHIISCQLKNNDPSVALTADAWLSIPGIQLQFYNAKANDKGKMYFDVRDYYGQNEIIIQTDNSDSNYHIDVLNPFSEKYSDAILPEFSLPAAAQNSLNEQSIGMQVLNTYEANKLGQFTIPVIDTTPFYGKPTSVYRLDDYTRFSTMEEVLREYVPEVAIRRFGGQLHLKVFDFNTHDFYPTDPLILLDGVKVDNNILLGYDPLKVKKLEVITNKYIKGEFIYQGIVNFTTYHGDMENLKLDPKAVILDYDGLQLKRKFYSPAYKTEQQAGTRLPDFRSLLFWEPDLQTDANGKAMVEFYTSDVKGKYVAVLQGMDDAGYAGSNYFTFDVTGK